MSKRPSNSRQKSDNQKAPLSISPLIPASGQGRPYSPILPPWLPSYDQPATKSEPTDPEPFSKLPLLPELSTMTGLAVRWDGRVVEDTKERRSFRVYRMTSQA